MALKSALPRVHAAFHEFGSRPASECGERVEVETLSIGRLAWRMWHSMLHVHENFFSLQTRPGPCDKGVGRRLGEWQNFLRAFSACEYHLLEHYLRGNFFPAPSAQASITTTNIAQKVANIRVGDH